jgi:two-component system chemotaxis sensor kinase CheA
MDYTSLIKDYLDDASGHLNIFDTTLLSLEKNGVDRDIILHLLGSLHTLKGNSGMMGFESLKIYIHQIEEILKKINDNEILLDRVIDGLLNSANVIRNALKKIASDADYNPDLTENILNLQQLIKGDGNGHEKQMVELSSYLGTKTDTIKVDFKRLDELLNLVGELVIFKTRLNQIETHIRGVIDDKSLSKELSSGLELMGKTISGLQEGIMKARMLPVSHVFNKFPRMVRDLTKSQGKDIQLILEGENTELDKTVIDELGEPLLHIIRNAIDHGIETTEERIRKGKCRTGKIILSASQESNYIIIRVTDDGKGINLDRIREKAIEKGLLKADDSIERDGLISFIFSPGFTTKNEATDVSGRGIGLDVVSKNISKLNGHVMVNSTLGNGTTFTIKLPLSLAIIPALMVETAGEVYAIPMNFVDKSIKVKEEDIHVINNHEVIRFREKVLPIVRLNEFFALNKSEINPPSPPFEKGGMGGILEKGDLIDNSRKKRRRFYLVILGRADKRLAIAVDKLRGRQEIVIKPLDDTFGKSYGIAGASILGNGRIVLIVDTMAFWNKKQCQ